MKIYICADMEGVAGVTNMQHLSPEGCEWGLARQWMTGEVLAAIEGARSAGATTFVVSDSHGNALNLLIDQLPDDVEVVRGWPRPLEMMQGIDAGSFAGAFFIGHHTGHTDIDGTIAHTLTGAVYELRLNGEPASESRLNAAIAGHYAVPVLLATGDRAYVDHVNALLPEAATVVTKTASSDYSVQTLTPERARSLIRAAAASAVQRAPQVNPYTVTVPVAIDVVFKQRLPAEVLSLWPGVARIGPTSVRFTAQDMAEASRMIVVATSYNPNGR